MNHLAPDELVDALDGLLVPARRGHLDVCDACRREVTAFRAMVGEMRGSAVPEPSPLFWDRLSARVREAIDEPPAAPSARWFHIPVLAPLAAMTLVVVGLIATMAGTERVRGVAPEMQIAARNTSRGDEVVDLEAQWALVADLVGDLDSDAAQDAGIAMTPGVADRAISQMSVGEQQELLRLLREELRAGG